MFSNELNLIAAVDENWGIGCDNELLFRIPADLRLNFRARTLGQVVVMGRRTFESLPGQKPLPDRVNIVLSRNMSTGQHDQLVVCGSFDELASVLKNYAENKVFIAGGAEVYEQLLPYCTKAYITKVLAVKEADRFLVDLDFHEDWELSERGAEQIHDGRLRFFFTTYNNLKFRVRGSGFDCYGINPENPVWNAWDNHK
jgi:dihydrofolate reductase